MVAERILNAIIAGEVAPGERLTEIALADQHQVSRATVREALVQLERQRFVDRLPRYGARVAAISVQDVTELFEIRAALLALAASKASTHATDEELQRFEATVAAIERIAARASSSPQAYAEHSIAAQHQVIAMSRSRWIDDLYMQLANLTLWRAAVRNRAISFATPARRRQSAADWRRIADALGSRDVAASDQAARSLILASGRFVQAQLAAVRKADDVSA
jgi:DNA-binding GntR family transcriptional regulator